MKKLNVLGMLAAIAVFTGCSSLKTSVSFDAKANFTGLKTYAWIPYPAAQRADVRLNYDFLDQEIHAATDRELRAKGLLPAVNDQPDFRIRWYVSADERATDSTVDTYHGFTQDGGWGYDPSGQWLYVTPMYQSSVKNYTVGSLVLDFLGAKTNKMLWRGGAQAVVNPAATPAQKRLQIEAAIKQLLQQFPPAKK